MLLINELKQRHIASNADTPLHAQPAVGQAISGPAAAANREL
jgi:hypothetical protein